jgi:hypothetical protein
MVPSFIVLYSPLIIAVNVFSNPTVPSSAVICVLIESTYSFVVLFESL